MELLNDSNYKQKTAHGNVIVKFTAPWCVPCKTLQPVIERLQETWRDKASFCMIDVDRTSVAGSIGVTSIPTLVMYKSGMPVKRITGVHDYGKLHKLLQEVYNE